MGHVDDGCNVSTSLNDTITETPGDLLVLCIPQRDSMDRNEDLLNELHNE